MNLDQMNMEQDPNEELSVKEDFLVKLIQDLNDLPEAQDLIKAEKAKLVAGNEEAPKMEEKAPAAEPGADSDSIIERFNALKKG